jgi:predicted metal-dependent phosphoesterase TrpH
MPAVNWKNPYQNKGRLWLKGNLHTHTNASACGRVALTEVVKTYERMGYAFLAITDHNRFTETRQIKSRLVFFPGMEKDFKSANHMCVIHRERQNLEYSVLLKMQALIDCNVQKRGIVILSHPNWKAKEHYPLHELCKFNNYTGIEIYNSVIERDDGIALATEKWDKLLSAGKYVLGYANQDFHRRGDNLDCCNVVHVNKKDKKEIFNALVTGNFYCFYGVEIKSLRRMQNTVTVKTRNALCIRFVGSFGRILLKVKSKRAEIKFSDYPDTDYIRIECLGAGERISWSQPFFK